MAVTIQWPQVTEVSRRVLEARKMLPVGASDAEVVYELLKFLDRALAKVEKESNSKNSVIWALERQLSEAVVAPKGKTKQRLAELEEVVGGLENKVGRLLAMAGLDV